MQAAAPGIQSAGRCASGVTPDNIDKHDLRSVGSNTQLSGTSHRRLQQAERTVCHANWIAAWQIPYGSWLHNHSRGKSDISINESSARPKRWTFEAKGGKKKQEMLLLFSAWREDWCPPQHFCCYPQMHICPRALPAIQHLLMLNPLIFVKSLIQLASEGPSLQKRLRRNPKGITGPNVWKLQFNLSFRSW